jgi:hypothetical protein
MFFQVTWRDIYTDMCMCFGPDPLSRSFLLPLRGGGASSHRRLKILTVFVLLLTDMRRAYHFHPHQLIHALLYKPVVILPRLFFGLSLSGLLCVCVRVCESAFDRICCSRRWDPSCVLVFAALCMYHRLESDSDQRRLYLRLRFANRGAICFCFLASGARTVFYFCVFVTFDD